MPSPNYNLTNQLPPDLEIVLAALTREAVRLASKTREQWCTLIMRTAKVGGKTPKTAAANRYFQFFNREGVMLREAKNVYVADPERIRQFVAFVARTASLPSKSDGAIRLASIVVERQRLNVPVPTMSMDAVAMLPPSVTTPTDEVAAFAGVGVGFIMIGKPVADPTYESAVVSQPAPKQCSVRPCPPKTHIAFFTKDELAAYTPIAALYDEATMRVGVPREFEDFIEMFEEAGLLRRLEDSGDNGHCPCSVFIQPSMVVDVKIEKRQAITRDETGSLTGIAPINNIVFDRVEDGVSYYRLPDDTNLRCLVDFESFVVSGDPARVHNRALALRRANIMTHNVVLSPNMAARRKPAIQPVIEQIVETQVPSMTEVEITEIKVSSEEAVIILGFAVEGGALGISQLNSRFASYLKIIGFLRVAGIKRLARTSIVAEHAATIRFVRDDRAIHNQPRVAVRRGFPDTNQWRLNLQTIAASEPPKVPAAVEVLKAEVPTPPIGEDRVKLSIDTVEAGTEDLASLTDTQLDRYEAACQEIVRVAEVKLAAIAIERVAREERRRAEAEKARRRAELETQLVSKRAAAELARRVAEVAVKDAAAVEAELAKLG